MEKYQEILEGSDYNDWAYFWTEDLNCDGISELLIAIPDETITITTHNNHGGTADLGSCGCEDTIWYYPETGIYTISYEGSQNDYYYLASTDQNFFDFYSYLDLIFGQECLDEGSNIGIHRMWIGIRVDELKVDDPQTEEEATGKNWWAEAIGAYTAWQYTDLCENYSIGIVDEGFDLDHSEFSGRIKSLFWQDPETLSTDEGYIDHGTHVTGIIGAANNTEGIRGIADTADLLVVNWTAFSVYDEFLKANVALIAAGARVVNNSYSDAPESKSTRRLNEMAKINFWEWDWKTILGMGYNDYLSKEYQESASQSLDGLIVLAQ